MKIKTGETSLLFVTSERADFERAVLASTLWGK